MTEYALPANPFVSPWVTDGVSPGLSNTASQALHLQGGCLYHQEQLYIPEGPLRLQVLQQYHDAHNVGHCVFSQNTQTGHTSILVDDSPLECEEVCPVMAKVPCWKPQGLLLPLPTPTKPWSAVSMKCIVELPPSHSYTVILVVVDLLTKMVHFITVRNLPTASQTAHLFVEHVFCLHKLPDVVILDRGPQFAL